MNLYGISNILTTAISLSLAIFVYFKARERRLSRIWSLFAVSAALYGFGAYLMSNSSGLSGGLFWWKIGYVGVIALPFFFVCLVYEFLNIRRPLVIRFMGALTAAFIIMNLSLRGILLTDVRLFFTEMKWVSPLYFPSPAHPLLMFFILFNFFGWVIYGHIVLIRRYHKLSGVKRDQAKYFFFAATLGFVGGGASFLPCFGISFYPILNFAVPLYFIITSFAILRLRLMDIRVVITRTGIFVAVYTLLLGIPFLIALRLKEWLIVRFGLNWWMPPAGLMAASATLGPFIYIYLQHKAEKRLFSEQRSYQETLKQAAREMARVRNFKKLLNLIVHTVTRTVRIAYSAVYLADNVSGKFLLKASRGIKKTQPLAIEKDTPLTEWFRGHHEPLVYDEISREAQENPEPALKQIEEEMLGLNAAVIVPGFLEDKLIGLLVLGDKRTKKIYTTEDLNTFSLLANQAALAIENALLYGNMEEQVKQRTAELVDVQKQLIQAEKLATVGTLAGGVAHEINNPLTAILTNIQMMLAMPEEKPDRESLELIEEATKRCRTIVQKLMTYAKKPLETTETAQVDLSAALKTVSSFLGYQLQQDNIEVTIDAKNAEYLVMGNQNELEQVITNIILNARDAIKQAKSGGEIHIGLEKEKEWIKVNIRDEGIGIRKEIIHKIFDPFFTTKDVGKGVGLGLSICQSIVEKHKGKITVDSEPGRGTEFSIWLPRLGAKSRA